VYFWEHGPRRALEWAQTKARRGDGVVKNPAVLGAYIHLGNCFDLLDTKNTALLTETFPKFVAFCEREGATVPQNREIRGTQGGELPLRYLDSAVINWFADEMEARGEPYQTVRGAFTEGGPCFPGSKLMSKTHVQLAVRDQSCILGFFRPPH
jgi:hypothetical protein